MCTCTRSHTFPAALQFEVWRISWPWWDQQEWDVRVRTFTHISSCSAVRGMAYKLAVVGPAGVGCAR